jgi:hypothetical protein
LSSRVVGIALVAEKLHHVRDILLAASKCVLRAHVVDANEQRLASKLLWRLLIGMLGLWRRTTHILWRARLRRRSALVLRRAAVILRRAALIALILRINALVVSLVALRRPTVVMMV